MTAFFMLIGHLLGGRQGLIIAFFFAAGMNFFSYWYSDKIVLRMFKAREATPDQAPELYGLVQDLANRAGLPTPRVYIIPQDSPNAFATGRNPENAVVAVTEGLLKIMNRDELAGVLGHELAHVKNRDILIGSIAVACGTPAASPEPTKPAATSPGTATEAPEPTTPPEPESKELTLAGSTSVQPVAENLANAFMAMHPDVVITVQGGGSSVGVKSAGEGAVDIGNASRKVKDEEFVEYPDLVVHTVARDGIAIVVHPDVPVDGLTKDQVKGIYEGSISMWDEVGGTSVPIIVVGREEGSGTRGAFGELVMGDDEFAMVETAILQPSNGAVMTTVSTTPDSIGFISFGYIDESTRPLAMDGVEPTVANANSGDYAVVRPLSMLTKGQPTGVVKAFLDFVFSDEGQVIVVDEGYLSVG